MTRQISEAYELGRADPLCLVLASSPGRIEVHGELDIATSPELVAAGFDHGAQHDLTLDLTHLRFIDATGISAIIELNLQLYKHDRRLVLVGTSATILRVFRLADADWVLNLRPDIAVLERLRDCALRAIHALRSETARGLLALPRA